MAEGGDEPLASAPVHDLVLPPPFADGATVRCIRDSPDLWIDGDVIDICRCMAGHEYRVAFTVWSSVYGWLIATPPPVRSGSHELHRASDFVSA